MEENSAPKQGKNVLHIPELEQARIIYSHSDLIPLSYSTSCCKVLVHAFN